MPPPYQYVSGEASASLTVTPVFRWEPRRIYAGRDDHQGSPDPKDTPPDKLWYYENSSATAVHSAGAGHPHYTPQSPYSGSHFTIEEVDNGLGSGREKSDSTEYYTSILERAEKEHVVVVSTGGMNTVHGNTRSLSARVVPTSAGLISYHDDEGFDAIVSLSYQVDTISFEAISRIRAGHDASDLYTDLRGGDYSHAGIAAGGFESLEHKADIIMSIRRRSGNWGYGSPIPNVPRVLLPRLRIHNREGVNKAARGLEVMGVTDGSGRVLSDILTSRDLETHYGPGGDLTVSFANDDALSHRIYINWGRTKWRMGQNGEKEWDSNFFSAMQEDKFWLWTKVMFRDEYGEDKGLPLTGHSMKFVITRLQVREKDANGRMVERVYTTTPILPYSDLIDSYEGTRLTEIILVNEIDASKYIEFSPATVRDNKDGIYKTQAKVLKNPDQTLRHFIVELEDQGVHRPSR